MARVTKAQGKKIAHVDSENKPVDFPISDRAAKRVIAPFVRIIRKGQRPSEVEESKQFRFYLQKKPKVLIRDLSSFLSDSVDLASLLHETADVLKIITKSAGVTLYMMDPASNEIYQSRTAPIGERFKVRWKITEGTTVAAYVAYKKDPVMLDDIIEDTRFPDGIGYESESIKAVLCVPVVTPAGECFAVIELYKLLFDSPFSKDDLKITLIVTGWMGAAIHENSKRLALQRQQELNDYLLDLTKCYFGDNVDVEKMMTEILKFVKVSLGAERASFFVMDKDSDDLVADLFEEEVGSGHIKKSKVRFGKERGIANLVARSGITVNVKDAYKDARFNKEIDQKTGFITRSILCMPIMGVSGVLGVMQIVNKKSGGSFTTTDEALCKTFSVYCALALFHARVTKRIASTKHLNNIFRKILELQQRPCLHDLQTYLSHYEVKVPPEFNSYNWYIKQKDHSKMPQFCVYMMMQMVDENQIDLPLAMQFVLAIRQYYRKNPYHNFEHAFNVFHCIYLIVKNNLVKFSALERKALLIAALCHDIDHGGFTNNFLALTNDDLTYLYEDSVLENHNFEVTKFVLDNYKIFADLSNEEYKELCQEIKNAIIATDVSHFFIKKIRLERLYNEKSYDWKDSEHRSYLKGIIMMAADLSDLCKPFLISKILMNNLCLEYHRQGDMEKELGFHPLPIMDKEQNFSIPERSIQFLTVIAVPCYDILRKFLPNTRPLYDEADSLCHAWQDIIDVRGKKCWRQDDSLVQKSSPY